MSDQDRLAGYVAMWKNAIDDFVALLGQVPAPEWTTPTLATDREPFVVLAGGQRALGRGRARTGGDQELGARVVVAMATTP